MTYSASCRHKPVNKTENCCNQSEVCMFIIKKNCFQEETRINLHISSGLNIFFHIWTFSFLLHDLQISELKPATSYMFIVRAENSYGLSVPSPVSSVIKTLDSNRSITPPNELVAARAFLSGKVSFCLANAVQLLFSL